MVDIESDEDTFVSDDGEVSTRDGTSEGLALLMFYNVAPKFDDLPAAPMALGVKTLLNLKPCVWKDVQALIQCSRIVYMPKAWRGAI